MEPHPGLNNLDYTVLGIVLLSGIFALFRGFVREVLSLITWTAAYFVAAKYYHLIEPQMHHYIKNDDAVALASGVALFCATLVVLMIISSIIARFVQGQTLTAIDRSLGFVFGLLRGGLIVCIIYLAAVAIWWPDMDKPPEEQNVQNRLEPPALIAEAKTRPALAFGSRLLKDFIPEKDIEKQAQAYGEQKAAAQRLVNQKMLDMMSTPTTPGAKDAPPPTYDDKSRSGLDQLINQKAKP